MHLSRAAAHGLAGLVVCSSLVATGYAQAVVAAPVHKPQPVEKVVKGAVRGVDSGHALKGTVTVKNAGGAHAPALNLIVQLVKGSTAEQVGVEKVPGLDPGKKHTVDVDLQAPSWLPTGKHVVRVCYYTSCKNVGALTRSSVPAKPVTYTADTPFKLTGAGGYWADVPAGYDKTDKTPTELFVWLHGCGGYSAGDIYNVSPPSGESWIVVAPLGAEGGCWDMGKDPARVMKVIADVRTHFNIDPRRVVLGGYSSGGDLTYRTAFYQSDHIAGVLTTNTSPFRDTGSTAAQSLRADRFKFQVVHVAHKQDMTYPIAGVESEFAQVTHAGFDVDLIEVDGTHYDDAGAGLPGTDADIRSMLLPHLDDGWLSPAR